MLGFLDSLQNHVVVCLFSIQYASEGDRSEVMLSGQVL